MPETQPLTAEQLQTFAERGVLRLDGLIPAEACADARAYSSAGWRRSGTGVTATGGSNRRRGFATRPPA